MPVQRRRRDHATEGAGHTVAGVVGHDQQHVGRALGRHHAGRPVGLGLQDVALDLAAEFLVRHRRELFAVNGGGGAWRTRSAGDLLCSGRWCEGNPRRQPKNHDQHEPLPSCRHGRFLEPLWCRKLLASISLLPFIFDGECTIHTPRHSCSRPTPRSRRLPCAVPSIPGSAPGPSVRRSHRKRSPEARLQGPWRAERRMYMSDRTWRC